MNKSGITVETAVSRTQILLHNSNYTALSIVVSQTGYVEVDGKKLILAGTPLTGDLDDRTTAFTAAVTTDAVVGDLVVPDGGGTVVLPEDASTNALGVLLHDVDVTDGEGNGALLIEGSVNTNRLADSVNTLLTAVVKTSMKLITFIAA